MYNGTISDLQHRVDDACLRFKAGAITSDLQFDYIEVDIFRNYADFAFDSEHLDLSARLDFADAPKRFGRTEIVLLDKHIICYTTKVAGKFDNVGAQALLNYTYFKGEYKLKQCLDSIGEFYFKEYPIKGYHADFFLPKYNLVIEYNGSHDIDEKRCSFFVQEGYIVCNVKDVPHSWNDLLKHCFRESKVTNMSKKAVHAPKSAKQAKDKQYYLDPHFAEKAANKGDLLQCFSHKGISLTYKDLGVDRSWFAKLKKASTSRIETEHKIPIDASLLKVLRLKSLPLIFILLRIALCKKISINKIKNFYAIITNKTLHRKTLLKMLSQQKALCVQLVGHNLQIAYGQPAGLILEDGSKWQPQANERQKANLAKARAAKKKNKG